MRSRFTACSPLGLAAAAGLTVLSASCHFHDDDDGAGAASLIGPGSSGSFDFDAPNRAIREGEVADISARVSGGVDPANIASWNLEVQPGALAGGALVDRAAPSAVRFVAGTPGFYGIRATDVNASDGTFGFDVVSARGELTVSEVVGGTDDDEVQSRVTTSGDDMFLAERIGDAQAPQTFARVARSGTRELSINLPYKVVDLGADASGIVVTMELDAQDLGEALRRYDRNLAEDTNFAPTSLAAGVTWANVLSVADDGTIVLVTSELGGAVLCLDATGAVPAGGGPLAIPFSPAEVVDIATDLDGLVYVATSTEIIRVAKDGTIDNVNWTPDARTALTAMSTDDHGVLYVVSQDQEGGQCGSLRKINWLGTSFATLTEFSSANFFAARKLVNPVDICAYGDGSWRIYDDTFSIDPGIQHAAWIVAGNAPPDTSQEQ